MTIIKVKFLKLFALLFIMPLCGISQIEMPQLSPISTIEQKVGITDISITYSRPSARGRNIFGDFLPYGQIWRTGANAATQINFSDDVIIEGKPLEAGAYALFTVPGKEKWTLIFNNNSDQWGATEYSRKKDALRVKVPTEQLPEKVETFTISFSNITTNEATVNLMWENTLVSFRITTEVHDKVMAQIKEKMQDPGQDAQLYFQAATYYYRNNQDMDQALDWALNAVNINPTYYGYFLVAKIYSKLGKYSSAIEAANKSIKHAQKAGNQQYVQFNKDSIKSWSNK